MSTERGAMRGERRPPAVSSQQPLTTRPSGFTLVEILTALAVLMIALSGVIGLLYGSFQHGRTAADRSAAAILIPEAIRNIAQARYQLDGTYAPMDPADWDAARYSLGGGYYKFKYRLAKPADTDYTGLYALSVVCFRDTEGDPNKRTQLSDPVTVYLRERK